MNSAFDKLPTELQIQLKDAYFVHGTDAIKILQRLLDKMEIPCEIDGLLGTETIAACFKAHKMHADSMADAYGIMLRDFCYVLAEIQARNRMYIYSTVGTKGDWILRAEKFIHTNNWLTMAEHQSKMFK